MAQRDEATSRCRRIEEQSREAELRRQEMELKILKLEVELLRLKKRYYGPRADKLQSEAEMAQMLLEFARDLESRPLQEAQAPSEAGPAADCTVR